MAREIDFSIIITAHNEGRLAHRTIQSVLRSVRHAEKRGVSTEIVIILDRVNEETREYFSSQAASGIVKTVAADFGDLGLSRNLGARKASGKYAGFVDADDLVCENWFFEAFTFFERNRMKDIVLHPEYNITFGAQEHVWEQFSSVDSRFSLLNLIENNYWDAKIAARREVLLRHPYRSTLSGPGFGFEDWHWNCQTLAEGIEHHVVPGTVHFIRKKEEGSLLNYTVNSNRMIRPTKLLAPRELAAGIGCEVDEGRSGKGGRNIVSGIYSLADRSARGVYAGFTSVLNPVFRVYPGLYRLARFTWDALTEVAIRSRKPLSQWLIQEWKAIHSIEPGIFPDRSTVGRLCRHAVPEAKTGRQYLELCRQYPEKASHVFLIPWLKKGGADLVTLNYVEALVKGFGRQVVLISTERAGSPWKNRLPEGAHLIELGNICRRLSRGDQERLLAFFLIQAAPGSIHNINSDLGYRVFVKYGKALGSQSNLYASVFCPDYTEEGKTVGYAFSYLPGCFDNLKAVSSDNSRFFEELKKLYAYGPEKLHAHYQPSPMPVNSINERTNAKELNILWASRMDRQKRPDILLAISEACKDFPFRFHVYGSAVLDADVYTAALKKTDNIIFHGPFNGLGSLKTADYDMFLYTSQWDGIPNILIEAVSLGLPVIAPDVGGVGELIINGKTGMLVGRYDDVGAYVECLKNALNDSGALRQLASNALELVKKRHSRESFMAALRRFPGYLDDAEKGER